MKTVLIKRIWLFTLAALVAVGITIPGAFAAQRTLRIFVVANGDTEKNAYNAIGAAFTKANPGVKLEVEALASGVFFGVKQTRIANKEADICYEGPMAAQLQTYVPLIRSGDLVDLTGQPFIKRFFPSAVAAGTTIKGRIYGVPMGQYGIVTYYNADLLKKCGVNKVPASLPEFVAALKAVKAKGYTGIALANKDGWQITLAAAQILNQLVGGKIEEFMKGINAEKIPIDGPVMTQMFRVWSEFIPYYTQGCDGMAYEGQPQEFAAGQAAFMFDGSWQINAINSAKPEFTPGIMALPVTETAVDKPVGTIKADPNLFVLNTPQKDLALKFLEFLSRPANYKKWQGITHSVPTMQGVALGDSKMEKDLLKLVANAAPEYWVYQLPGSSLSFVETINVMRNDKKTLSQAMAFLRERWESAKPGWDMDLKQWMAN